MAKVLFEEQTVSGFAYASAYGCYNTTVGNPAPFVPEDGGIYTVVWDGVTYPCAAFAFTDLTSGVPFIGIGNVIMKDGVTNSGEPFAFSYNVKYGGLYAFSVDTAESHTVAVYKPDNAIVLKDRNGNDTVYTDVNAVKLNTLNGGTQFFSIGEAEETTIDLDFSGGNMIVTPDAEKLFSSVTIPVPDNLAAENIAKDVTVAGIIGTHEGGGLVDYTNTSITSAGYHYQKFSGVRSFTFTKLQTVSGQAFYQCADAKKFDFHAITALSILIFWGTPVETLIIRTNTMCTLPEGNEGSIFGFGAEACNAYIYVPSALVETYKADSGWGLYADRIRAIEDYPDICG